MDGGRRVFEDTAPLRTLKVLANFNVSSTINDELSELSSQFENLIRLGIVPIVHGLDDWTDRLEESLMRPVRLVHAEINQFMEQFVTPNHLFYRLKF